MEPLFPKRPSLTNEFGSGGRHGHVASHASTAGHQVHRRRHP